MSGFTDPIVRCTECQNIITREQIQEVGCCPKCACKRVKEVKVLSDLEYAEISAKFPQFASTFEHRGDL